MTLSNNAQLGNVGVRGGIMGLGDPGINSNMVQSAAPQLVFLLDLLQLCHLMGLAGAMGTHPLYHQFCTCLMVVLEGEKESMLLTKLLGKSRFISCLIIRSLGLDAFIISFD